MNNEKKRMVRSPNFIFRKIVDEMVLVPVKQDVADLNAIFTLNDLGAFIWDRLAEPCTRAELEEAILEIYETDPQTLNADLEKFLSQMFDIGAIKTD